MESTHISILQEIQNDNLHDKNASEQSYQNIYSRLSKSNSSWQLSNQQ